MDPSTILLISTSALLLLRYSTPMLLEALPTLSLRFFQMAGMKIKFAFGGIWWFFGGALLVAYVVSVFFIFPLMGVPSGLVFNIQTLAAFTYPIPFLIFFGIWLGVGFGAFGLKVYKFRGSK